MTEQRLKPLNNSDRLRTDLEASDHVGRMMDDAARAFGVYQEKIAAVRSHVTRVLMDRGIDVGCYVTSLGKVYKIREVLVAANVDQANADVGVAFFLTVVHVIGRTEDGRIKTGRTRSLSMFDDWHLSAQVDQRLVPLITPRNQQIVPDDK